MYALSEFEKVMISISSSKSLNISSYILFWLELCILPLLVLFFLTLAIRKIYKQKKVYQQSNRFQLVESFDCPTLKRKLYLVFIGLITCSPACVLCILYASGKEDFRGKDYGIGELYFDLFFGYSILHYYLIFLYGAFVGYFLPRLYRLPMMLFIFYAGARWYLNMVALVSTSIDGETFGTYTFGTLCFLHGTTLGVLCHWRKKKSWHYFECIDIVLLYAYTVYLYNYWMDIFFSSILNPRC